MRAAGAIALPRNRITAAEASLFAHALRTTRTLTAWDMSDNELGDEGVASLSQALAANRNCPLRVLDLTYNNMRAAGAAALAKYVTSSTRLLDLSIRNNEVGEAGGAAVGQMLTASLTRLDVSGCKLGTGGLPPITRALHTNQRLTSLSVQGLGDDGLRVLGVALHSNPHSSVGSVACDAFDTDSGPQLQLPSSGFGTGAATLLSSVLKVSTAHTALSLDAFGVPLGELKGPKEAPWNPTLPAHGPPPPWASARDGKQPG